MKIVPIFAYYDVWIGAYWDRARRRLYIFPLPMIGFYIQFEVVADSLPEYFVIAAAPLQKFTAGVNDAISKGYVPLGAPIAIKVQPDLFAAAYYQWAQALVLKKR